MKIDCNSNIAESTARGGHAIGMQFAKNSESNMANGFPALMKIIEKNSEQIPIVGFQNIS